MKTIPKAQVGTMLSREFGMPIGKIRPRAGKNSTLVLQTREML
jgi:hypothetical protein